MSSDLISIIIPAFNQLHYCRQCVHTVLANTRPPYRIILVDNGSTDGVGPFFDSIPGAEVVHTGQNLGFASGVNAGLTRAEGHILLLNSDTLVPETWLETLEQPLYEDPRIGLIGPMSNCVSGRQQIDGLTFTTMDEINTYAHQLAQEKAGRRTETPRLVGFCLLIREQTWRELGPFDEAYGIGNFEDDDYCIRALRANYRLCIAQDAFVFHYGSRTFLGMGLTDDKWDTLLAENATRFQDKWRVRPEERIDAALQSRRLNDEARLAVQQGDSIKAVHLLKQAIETFPLLEVNFNDLGVILWQMGDQKRALSYFERAITLNPDFEDAKANFTDATHALTQKDTP